MSAGLKMRMLQLENLVNMLTEMEILIRFRALRTGEIIKELSAQESFRNFIFLNILNDCTDEPDCDISEQWQYALKRTVFFSDSDKRILLSVGEQIGSTDIEGQLSMLSLNKNLARRNLDEAERDFRIKGRMLRTVWGLCGIAAGIIII